MEQTIGRVGHGLEHTSKEKVDDDQRAKDDDYYKVDEGEEPGAVHDVVHDIGPALEGYGLEECDYSPQDIVEMVDPVVRVVYERAVNICIS